MASKLGRNRALASAFRPSQPSIRLRNEAVVRCFATSVAARGIVMPKDAPNPRSLPRDNLGQLKAPLVNPADKYQSKADNLHKYGSWLMGCLPKYIQQFSVWKDELTIYICPTGVIPVFSFLKCKTHENQLHVSFSGSIRELTMMCFARQHLCRVHPGQRYHRRRLPHP